jgi:ClpA/ClpB-like protein
MFERFDEHARRAIFWGRNEAILLNASRVETEHLLLGLLRDDKRGLSRISSSAIAAIRQRVEQSASKPEQKASASDLPLSDECVSVMMLAAEEAISLHHMLVDTPHLLLGMLRIEDCTAARLLREHGLAYDTYRDVVRAEPLEGARSNLMATRSFERSSPWNEAPSARPAAAALERSIRLLEDLLDSAAEHFNAYSESFGDRVLKRRPWTRKEALGHLIDWAMAYQQWLICALTESKLAAAGYPDEAAVAIQGYDEFSWTATVDLWMSLNRLLVHVLLRIPEDKASVPCRIGIADPVPLTALVARYVERSQDIVGQIVAHL